MATPEYWQWIAAGRPWQVAKPIAEMVALARSQGITILGTIGNEDHLTASFPEDHTPFSYSAYPVKLPGWWVTACDIANSKGWGDAILRDARAGLLPWLKYMNVAGKHYAWTDGFKQGFANSDQHIHLSCFSDDLGMSIGGYNPLNPPVTTNREVPTMNGKIVKGEPAQCVPVPVVTGRKRIFSLGADLGNAKIRVAFGSPGNKWKVYEGMMVGNAVDPWTPELPADCVKISILFTEGDSAAIGWSVIYV